MVVGADLRVKSPFATDRGTRAKSLICTTPVIRSWPAPTFLYDLIVNEFGHVSVFIILNKNAEYLHQRCQWMTLVFPCLVN
jgi:hypothetical protein